MLRKGRVGRKEHPPRDRPTYKTKGYGFRERVHRESGEMSVEALLGSTQSWTLCTSSFILSHKNWREAGTYYPPFLQNEKTEAQRSHLFMIIWLVRGKASSQSNFSDLFAGWQTSVSSLNAVQGSMAW